MRFIYCSCNAVGVEYGAHERNEMVADQTEIACCGFQGFMLKQRITGFTVIHYAWIQWLDTVAIFLPFSL